MWHRAGLDRFHIVLLTLLGAALICLAVSVSLLQPLQTSATDGPQIDKPILSVIHGRPSLGQPVSEPLVITGQNFGDAGGSSGLKFTFGEQEEPVSVPSVNVPPNDAIVLWTPNEIRVKVPGEVATGTLRVIAGGEESDPVDFLVYEYDSFDIPDQPGSGGYGLALAVAPDGKVWLNREYHAYLQVFDPASSQFDIFPDPDPEISPSIPQGAEEGIFADFMVMGTDKQVLWSGWGEDIEIDSQGNVWLTQGGGYLYPGKDVVACPFACGEPGHPSCQACGYYNTSRVIKYDPVEEEFSCINSPLDNSQVLGVLINETGTGSPNGEPMVWYTEGNGQAMVGIKLSSVSTLDNCYFDPYAQPPQPRDSLCGDQLGDDCHWRLALPEQTDPLPSGIPNHMELDDEGNIWFTQLFGGAIQEGDPPVVVGVPQAVGRLTPESGDIIFLPLPAPFLPDVRNGAWDLRVDNSNHVVWVTEFYDAAISRIDPGLMVGNDCENLNPEGLNPCIEEMFVDQNETGDAVIHVVHIAPDGKAWFGVGKNRQTVGDREIRTVGELGFIDPAREDTAVTLPLLRSEYHDEEGAFVIDKDGIGDIAGVVVRPGDDDSYDIYFVETIEEQLGRLRLVFDTDGDGVFDATDNCPLVSNPGQENTDSAGIPNGADIVGDFRANPDKDPLGDACDTDRDNDGPDAGDDLYTDTEEATGCGFGPTDPLKKDSDSDGAIDGYECKVGTDPNNPADRLICTDLTDTDGDGISDCVEELGYGTSPLSTDTDGDSSGNDGCQDDKQIVDVNGDGQANFLDVTAVARIAFAPGPFDPVSVAVADIDKNGFNNVLDVQKAALNSTLVEPHDPCG